MGRTQQESRALKEMEILTGVGGGGRETENWRNREQVRDRETERGKEKVSLNVFA